MPLIPSSRTARLVAPALAVFFTLAGALLPTLVWADGGRVQFSRERNDLRVTVFTSPTPLVAGPIDVSVLVQDAHGRIVPEAKVQIIAEQPGYPHTRMQQAATHAAATNKLLQAAKFALPIAGNWQITVEISHAGQTISESFAAELGPPLPSWKLAGWVLWPLAPISLFALREIVKARRTKSNE